MSSNPPIDSEADPLLATQPSLSEGAVQSPPLTEAAALEDQSSSSKVLAPSKAQSLELGWTQVRPHKRGRSEIETEDDQECCKDPTCQRRRVHDTLSTRDVEQPTNVETETFQGRAVFLLHEDDAEWFQGYFLGPDSCWGMLAEQVEVDECLCGGGYRQIRLSLFTSGVDNKVDIGIAEWTGGDMMRLVGPNVEMDAKQVLTGHKAAPYIEKLFSGLLRRAAQSMERERDGLGALEILPDATVIVGEMLLTVHVEKK